MASEIPEAIWNRFDDFLDYLVKTVRLINIAVLEVHRFPQSVALMEAVDNLKQARGEPVDQLATAQAREAAPLAIGEAEQGFPLFYGLGAVSTWGTLEAYIEDLLSLCLENDRSFMELESVLKIKVPISQYDSMTVEERRNYIIDAVEREGQSRFKQGVSQFESVLGTFGLGGEVAEDSKKTLFELSNVRNVIVHRNGRADKRLVTSCPWLRLTIGDTVRIDGDMFSRYSMAVPLYAGTVFRRVILHFGGSTESLDAFIAGLAKSARVDEHSSK